MSGGAIRGHAPTLSVAVVGTVPALANVVGRLLGRSDDRLVVDTLEDPREVADRVAERHYDCVVWIHDGHRAGTDLLTTVRGDGTSPAVVLVGHAPAEEVTDSTLDEPATAYVRLPADPAAYDTVARQVRAVAERAAGLRGGRSTAAGTASAGHSRDD